MKFKLNLLVTAAMESPESPQNWSRIVNWKLRISSPPTNCFTIIIIVGGSSTSRVYVAPVLPSYSLT